MKKLVFVMAPFIFAGKRVGIHPAKFYFMTPVPVLFLFIFLVFSSCCDKDDVWQTECEKKCSIRPEQGNETANAGRYFFDPVEKKCKLGRWTGSDTLKPFESLDECEACGCK